MEINIRVTAIWVAFSFPPKNIKRHAKMKETMAHRPEKKSNKQL